MSKHIDVGKSGGRAPIVFKSGEPVSVICVASTFTVVSYANNGGKVRLSSAGVHGLTTSPAVGASVYVAWSGGTGINGLYKVLSIDSTTAFTIDATHAAGLGTPAVAVAGTEISAVSFGIPPLDANSFVRTTIGLSMTSSTNGRYICARLNSSIIGTAATFSSGHTGGFFTVVFKNQNNKSSQISVVNIGGLGFLSTTNTATAIDTSINTVFSISPKMAAANEIIRIEYAVLEVFL